MQDTTATRKYIDEFLQTAAPVFDLIPGVVLIQNVADGRIEYMSKRGEQYLGMTVEELRQMSLQEYHQKFFNNEEAKEYGPQVLELLQKNNPDEIISFFQQVLSKDKLQLHATTTKIFYWDAEGKPLLFITLSMRLDPEHHLTAKVERLINENNFLRKNQTAFSSLTKREKMILQQMATGKTPDQIANDLYISIETARTHRKNIKAKLRIQSNYDITRFAQAFDLI